MLVFIKRNSEENVLQVVNCVISKVNNATLSPVRIKATKQSKTYGLVEDCSIKISGNILNELPINLYK